MISKGGTLLNFETSKGGTLSILKIDRSGSEKTDISEISCTENQVSRAKNAKMNIPHGLRTLPDPGRGDLHL